MISPNMASLHAEMNFLGINIILEDFLTTTGKNFMDCFEKWYMYSMFQL